MANSRPRIVIAASTYPPDPGGPSIHAEAHFKWLKSRGLEVSLITLAQYRFLAFGLRHFMFFIKLFSLSLHHDIIYAYDALGVGLPALISAKLLGKKIVIRIGGDIPWERKADRGEIKLSLHEWYAQGLQNKSLLFKISRIVIKNVDKVIVTSSLLSELYKKYYGVRTEKITVISNPIPNKVVSGNSIGEKTMVFASRLVAYKNLDLVFQTLARIFPSHQDLSFIVMGDGPERKSLETLAKNLGISKQIIFTGSIPNSQVLDKTSRCLFGLAPALTEFNPNYILQCLAFDKPFITSRENGFPFKIPEDFIFESRNSEELEKKIRNMLDPDGYRQAKEEAKNIDFKMSWEDVHKKNLEIIQALS